MAELSDNTNWSELDANNNKAAPNGWPEGMMPSGVNDSARADKGALKRHWNRINPVQSIAPASGVWTFTTGNPAYPAAYVNGEVYTFQATADSGANDSFQVNALGAKPIYVLRSDVLVERIRAYDIMAAARPSLVYDSSLNGGAGGFLLRNPWVPVYLDSAGNVTCKLSLTIDGQYLYLNGASGTGGPVLYGDAGNMAIKPGAGNGQLFLQDAAGVTRGSYNFSNGDFTAAGLTSNGDLSVAGTGIFAQNITVGGLNVANNSGYLATAAPLMVGNIGIQYTPVSGAGADGGAHTFRLGWGSGHVVAAVDGSGAIVQLANTGDLGAYLPLGGGTITGNLTVNNGLTVGGGGIYTTGPVTTGSLNTGPNGITTSGLICNGGANISGPVNTGTLNTGSNAVTTAGLSCSGGASVAGNMNIGGTYQRSGNGALIECFPGGSWGSMSFAMISGGYLGASPDGGASGFNYAPNGSWSDARLKTNIRATKTDALAAILATPVHAFEWNEKGRKRMPFLPERIPVGLVAQEVEKTMPEVVHTMGPFGDDMLMIRDHLITPYVFRALQQLAERVQALEAQCSAPTKR